MNIKRQFKFLKYYFFHGAFHWVIGAFLKIGHVLTGNDKILNYLYTTSQIPLICLHEILTEELNYFNARYESLKSNDSIVEAKFKSLMNEKRYQIERIEKTIQDINLKKVF